MENIFRTGIRGKLIGLFLLLGIGPMLGTGAVFYCSSTKSLSEHAESQMQNSIAKAMEQLDAQFTTFKMHMENIVSAANDVLGLVQGEREILHGSQHALSNDYGNYQKKYPVFTRIRIFTAAGDQKFSTGKDGGSADPKKFSSSPWFQNALQNKETQFSDVLKGDEFKEPTLVMAKSVLDAQDKPFAVVAVDIPAGAFTLPVDTIKIGKGGYAFILNKDGFAVAYPDKAKVLQVNFREHPFGKEMLRRKSGQVEYTWEGNTKYASFAEYTRLHWIVAASVPKGEILGSVNRMGYLFGILVLVSGIVSFLLAVVSAQRLTAPIRRAISGLTDSSHQVAAASAQVSKSAQNLAEGASEQASSLEETSASLEEMSSMTKQNADSANQAKEMMEEAGRAVAKVSGHMGDMGKAMDAIIKTSEDTGNIIRTIDEIAFQTNLLALNAAVEAARAGEAGAGFAVVAEEVRNLAMRSAEAAKNTNSLIENTIAAVKNGHSLTMATQTAFQENIELSEKIQQLVDEIAAASVEQSRGIGEINNAVSSIDKVIQQSAASAEESASASRLMTDQAARMKGYVQELAELIGRQETASPKPQ